MQSVLDALMKNTKPGKYKPRSKKDRAFRRELKKILGSHRWTDNPKLAKQARKELTELSLHAATFEQISSWYIYRKLHEESISRRVFKVTH